MEQSIVQLFGGIFGLFLGGVVLGNSFSMRPGPGQTWAIMAALIFAMIGVLFVCLITVTP